MDCIFCKIANKEINSTIVYEDDTIVAFNDIHPQAPHHKLLIPKKHIASINEVDETDATLLSHLIFTAKKLAHDLSIAESGYRLVFNCNRGGGQDVYHLHLHLLGGRQMVWPPG